MQYSIATYSELERTRRIDAEFFSPIFLELHGVLSRKKTLPLTELCNISDGNHMSVASYFQDKGEIPYFRGKDINTDFFLENAAPLFIPENIYQLPYMKRSWFQENDILLSIVGTIGSLSKVTDRIRKSTGSCKIAILRSKKIDSNYIAAFLSSNYGQFQIKRNTRGAVQQGLLLEDMDQMQVYIPTEKFENRLSLTIEDSIKFNRNSKEIYEQAQALLLSELGLTDWQPKHRLSFIKNYSETEQAGRLDAEHFQPKYDELIEAITTNSFYSKNISEIQTHNARGLQPKYTVDGALDVITSKHILEHDLNYDGFEKTCESNWKKQKKARIQKGDILTYTTGANIGRTACYSISKPALASNHVNILRIRNENPEYVAFVMNSLIGRLQTERLSAGSAQAELYPKDIEKYLIPFTEEKIQQEIVALIEKSRSLKAQSKHLLECAKRAVELAIEQDEQTAMDWLEEETGAVLRQE